MYYNIIIMGLCALFMLVSLNYWAKCRSLKREAVAIEEGNYELAESYEMMLLTKDEKLATLGELVLSQQESIDMRESIIEHHARHCHNMADVEAERIMGMFEEEIECILKRAESAQVEIKGDPEAEKTSL